MLNTWVGLLNNTSADGTALNTSVTETGILSALHKYTLAANFCDFVGKKFRVQAYGRVGTVVTTPGTLTLRLKFGSIAVFNSGAIPLNIVAKTNEAWLLDLLCEVRSVGNGTAATIFAMGSWLSEANINTALASVGPGPGGCLLPFDTAPVVGAGFDSTAAQVVDLTAQWSVSNAANTIQNHLFAIEALN